MSKNYFFKCSKPLDCKKTSNLFFFLLTRNLYLVWVPTLHMQKGQIWSAGKIGDFSATVFSRFGPFGVDLGIIFSAKIRKISRFIAGTLESSTGGRNTLIKLSCHRDKFFVGENFCWKKISKSTPNGPKREKRGHQKIAGFAGRSVQRTEFDHFSMCRNPN